MVLRFGRSTKCWNIRQFLGTFDRKRLETHFMYFPLFDGSGYPRATAPSEAQKRPAETPHATAPTKTNQTLPYLSSQFLLLLERDEYCLTKRLLVYNPALES